MFWDSSPPSFGQPPLLSTVMGSVCCPLILCVVPRQSWGQAVKEAHAKLHLAVCPPIPVLPPCPLGQSHPSEGSAGPRSTEFLLQTLDKLVVEKEQLTMGQEAGEDALDAISPKQEVGAGGQQPEVVEEEACQQPECALSQQQVLVGIQHQGKS